MVIYEPSFLKKMNEIFFGTTKKVILAREEKIGVPWPLNIESTQKHAFLGTIFGN